MSQLNVMLSLFDTRLSCEDKQMIVDNLNNPTPKFKTDDHHAIVSIDDIASMKLEDFVCTESLKFFEITKIDTAFLEKPARLWNHDMNRDYQTSSANACLLTVVNDPAERAVALVKYDKEHNFKPKDHTEFQQMMIAVDSYRKDTRLVKEDEELFQWYMNQPNLDCDDDDTDSEY